ncbi:MAG: zf-TFIIB domain-containing protein [Xanthomonadales bacterium]|nr:zf-TFIIB domain-containing protein [Xanthomonadales bacterium]
MDFSCPTCNVSLQAQKQERIRLWKCASCGGFAISLPIVRKELNTGTFKKIWQKLSSGEAETGRPCPGCKNRLNVVEADGQGGVIMIDICRSCHILWFDDKEYSDLTKVTPRVVPEVVTGVEQVKQSEGRFLTPEEVTFAVFEEDQHRRRSFLFKLLDGSVSKELGLDSFFGDFFDK